MKLTTTLIIFIVFMSGCSSRQAESWDINKILTKEDKTTSITQTIVVRACPVPEEKTLTCSTAVENSLVQISGFSIKVGGTVGVPVAKASAEAVADVRRELKTSVNQTTGESMKLPVPPHDTALVYTILTKNMFIGGQALAKSSSGTEQMVDYMYSGGCTFQIKAKKQIRCDQEVINADPTVKTVAIDLKKEILGKWIASIDPYGRYWTFGEDGKVEVKFSPDFSYEVLDTNKIRYGYAEYYVVLSDDKKKMTWFLSTTKQAVIEFTRP